MYSILSGADFLRHFYGAWNENRTRDAVNWLNSICCIFDLTARDVGRPCLNTLHMCMPAGGALFCFDTTASEGVILVSEVKVGRFQISNSIRYRYGILLVRPVLRQCRAVRQDDVSSYCRHQIIVKWLFAYDSCRRYCQNHSLQTYDSHRKHWKYYILHTLFCSIIFDERYSSDFERSLLIFQNDISVYTSVGCIEIFNIETADHLVPFLTFVWHYMAFNV